MGRVLQSLGTTLVIPGRPEAETGTYDRVSLCPVGLFKRLTQSRVPGSARCAAPE